MWSGGIGYPEEVSGGGRFHVLSFMMTLKAARDFGLDTEEADAIAIRFDPRRDHCHLVDALTAALVARGVVDVPGR